MILTKDAGGAGKISSQSGKKQEQLEVSNVDLKTQTDIPTALFQLRNHTPALPPHR